MSPNRRTLPIAADLNVVSHELRGGRRIVVTPCAGPKLGGKPGVIVAKGSTKSQVRVLLDGSRQSITLHVRFVKPADLN